VSASSQPTVAGHIEKDFVESLLSLLHKLDNMLRLSFGSKDAFGLALKLSLEHVLNLKQKQTAEQLARYVDRKLRAEKGISEQEIESQLDQVSTVLEN
jgi:hypothetical protein